MSPPPAPAPLAMGATIGIVGGGQLGRMLAMAAARLGFRTVVLDPQENCPAGQTASSVLVARYDDVSALRALAARSSVITYEFENVPVGPLRVAAESTPVFPPPGALEIAQDRVVEKAFLNGIGIATADWRAVENAQELDHALTEFGGDCILKTRQFGYDGKGQATIRPKSPHGEAFQSLGGVPSILERRVSFDYELSVIAARGQDGSVAIYDPAENVHSIGILKRSTVPGQIPPGMADEAKASAKQILERLHYVGVIGVEFFASRNRLYVNEIAPRVHNSGHWTEAACVVSQFEQHIRAVAGLPLGSTTRHFDCVMENLIGAEVAGSLSFLAEPGAVLHLYGKDEVRLGRKMGHVTRVEHRGAT